MYHTYNKFLSWRQDRLRDEDGIIIGADLSQEWLLSWWWKHYEKHNDHPVAFVDFGMSFEKKNWCKERGELIPLQIFEDFVVEKKDLNPNFVLFLEKEFGKHFWECRNVWFKKPMAFLQTPFTKSIWIDIDCEIRGSISPLFSYTEDLAIVKERGNSYKNYPIYNSGVILYRRDLTWIVDWAKSCIENNDQFHGDQDVLSHLIADKNLEVVELPAKYNWSRIYEDNADAVIMHWHGNYGKCVIRNQINAESLFI